MDKIILTVKLTKEELERLIQILDTPFAAAPSDREHLLNKLNSQL